LRNIGRLPVPIHFNRRLLPVRAVCFTGKEVRTKDGQTVIAVSVIQAQDARLSGFGLNVREPSSPWRKMAHALLAEVTELEIEAVRRRKLARVFETIIEKGIRKGDFPRQHIQAAGACIVASLIEDLIGRSPVGAALNPRRGLNKHGPLLPFVTTSGSDGCSSDHRCDARRIL
jgi:hypothetical protein